MSISTKSVLIIGATGAMGLQCLRHCAQEPNIAQVHVFCRTPSKFSAADRQLCASVLTGDARNSQDVEQAMRESKANYVILATGNGADLKKSDTREKTGQALALAMAKPEFKHVKAIIVSSHGAADTQIKVGMGIGWMISYHLKFVLADHTEQEKAFAPLMKRTLIVRPTALTDEKGGAKIVEFDGTVKGPSINIDRSDVADYITRNIADPTFTGRKVCITNAK